VSVKLTQDRTDSADSGANRLEIEIEDHWTIQRVKDQISKKLKEQGRESLLDGDKTQFQGGRIGREKRGLQISNRSTLRIAFDQGRRHANSHQIYMCRLWIRGATQKERCCYVSRLWISYRL